MTFETLSVRHEGSVAEIALNRPDKANAIDERMWREIRQAMEWLDATPSARVGILSGAGRHFTAGIDLSMLASIKALGQGGCGGRAGEALRRTILDIQDTVTAVERCRKPVLAAVHAACVGGGVDLITACDMRYCAADAWFSVKEVDVGLTADVGTLQRLPRLIGEGMARELAYTARKVTGREAEAIRLVNRCYDTAGALFAGVRQIAEEIASKSPLAVRGTKEMITYARDHTVADSLNYIATWNAAMLISDDLDEALNAQREKRAPRYAD